MSSEITQTPDTCKHDFCGFVKNPRTLSECTSIPASPYITTGKVIAKVPVVIAERTIQVDVESDIILDKPAFEIKRIYKSLYLTQCKLLPKVGKLFLSGYIRKNIEYATADCVENGVIAGEIRHTTVNVPFECVTFIPYDLGRPVYCNNLEPIQFQDFNQKYMGADRTETDQESTQFFNEKVYCELISAKFNEVDIQKHIYPIDGYSEFNKHYPSEYSFKKITEKLTVHLTFKLLQLQQVNVQSDKC